MALCTWRPATTNNQKHKFMLSTCLEENRSTKIFVRDEVPVRLQCPLWHHKVLIARTTFLQMTLFHYLSFWNTKKRKLSLMAPLKIWICKDQQPFKLWTCVFECIRRWQRTSHWHFSSTSGAGYPLLVTGDKREECEVDWVHVNWSERKNVAFPVNALCAWNWTDKDAPDSHRVSLTFPQRSPSCFALPCVFTGTNQRH